jgi:hypothetical protein
MNRTAKLSLGLGGVALLILALVSHAYYWYAPRPRVGRPGVEDPTSRLFFGARDLPLRVWVPFPHQNLAALEQAIGDLDGLSEVSSYLMSRDLASLPSFGPFRMPPARDLVVAGSPDGSRIVVAATVYPVVAGLARLAGRLAGNAWLAGGPVELHGRTVEVEWRDGMWIAAQGEGAELETLPVPDLQPTHSLVRLEQSLGPVPEGLYRVDVEARGWRIVSAEPAAMQASEARPLAKLPLGLALVAASIGSQSPPNSVIETFVLLSDVGGAGEQIARSVIAHRGAGERWQLPGERLLSGLGFEVSEGTQDGWSLAGYDEGAVLEVADQLSSILELLESVDEAPLNLGIWLDLAAARGALDGVVGTLTALPLPATEQIRLWTMAARSLASLDQSGSLSLRIGGLPPRLDMRLERQGAD